MAAGSEQRGLDDRKGQKERVGRGNKWVPFYSDAGRVSSWCTAAVVVESLLDLGSSFGPSSDDLLCDVFSDPNRN